MDTGIKKPRLAWALTGSGHFFTECLELMRDLPRLRRVRQQGGGRSAAHVQTRPEARCPRAPASSATARPAPRRWAASTTATITRWSWRRRRPTRWPNASTGISDNLVTNVFAQAGKCRVPIIVFACDTAAGAWTAWRPHGMVKVYPRRVDLENVGSSAESSSRPGGRTPCSALKAAIDERMACLNELLFLTGSLAKPRLEKVAGGIDFGGRNAGASRIWA